MRAGSREQEYKLRIVLLPNQEPVGFQVALPATAVLSRQLMGPIYFGKLAVGFKQADGGLEQLHVIAALAATFRVLSERLGHPYFVHTLRCLTT